ncbi:MAG: metallophosphoesterase [Firmicutes bacterium]|nr:metallophosphoesterase [Bacillota bacterium]
MSIYAIGDLHLSHKQDKPMDVFGEGWDNHIEKIKNNWNQFVKDDDLVIVVGDISWAMQLPEALPDLMWLSDLKGTKLLIRGNHDYWWSSISKLRAVLPPTLNALQNDHFTWEEYYICGTRGWICPGEEGFDNEGDERIYLREVHRLGLSLESAASSGAGKIIAALHFPPFNRKNQPSGFTELLEQYNVEICVFGHIHDHGRDYIFQGARNGVRYRFAAADGIGFNPLRLV